MPERPQSSLTGDGSPTLSSLDELAAEYLDRRASGSAPELDAWLAENVEDPAARAELRELIQAAADAESMLPTPVEARTLIRGRYRILEEIGAGGMGRVFAAYDEELGRRVAIKMLAAFDETDEERRGMFLRESRLLASMNHPNIVAVHDHGSEEGRTFIVMDLVEGRSLADVIASARKELEVRSTDTKLVPREADLWRRAIGRRIPEGRTDLISPTSWYETAGRVALELARTVEAAHACGVLHRDLKPQNVMLLGGANPVVLDFGLGGSVDVSGGAVTQGLFGSVAYLAPEQVESHRVGNDQRTDVYQLGLILYEMLTLRRAFPGESMGQVLDSIKQGLYKPARAWNAAIPRPLAAIAAMALELDPAYRYATAAELRADLERYFEGREDPIAMRSGRTRTLWRRTRWAVRRHPLVTAAAAMLLVVLATSMTIDYLRPKVPVRIDGLRMADNAFYPLGPHGKLERDDTLCLEIGSQEALYCYILFVYGERGSEEQFVDVCSPRSIEDREQKSSTEAMRLPPGEHHFYLAEVDESHSMLGAIVWTSEAPNAHLDDFLAMVDGTSDRDFGGGYPYEKAQEMLESSWRHRTRGRPVQKSDELKFERMRQTLLEQGEVEAAAWSLPGARAEEHVWKVRE